MCDGLARGDKVVHLSADAEAIDLVVRATALGAPVGPALASRQLVIRHSRNPHMHDGGFDVERMLTTVRIDHRTALDDGYGAVSVSAEMDWPSEIAPTRAELAEYERGITELARDGTLRVLCQYDHDTFERDVLTEVGCTHAVDISPELAPIGREGTIAAARVDYGRTLRLAGELDFSCAGGLGRVLEAHVHGRRSFDLADLDELDVAGWRALRGRRGQQVRITGMSASAHRLLGLIGWDADPDVVAVGA